MKKAILFISAFLLTLLGNAQIINGDLNNDGQISMGDVTTLIDDYLNNTQHTIDAGNPQTTANGSIVGTWIVQASSVATYDPRGKHVTFNEDGTTDYGKDQGYDFTYEYMPYQGRIMMYDKHGVPTKMLYVIKCTESQLILSPRDGEEYFVYGKMNTTIDNGHEYVDLGLSVKWATTNVGASTPYEPGNYYAWGETEVKDSYESSNYLFFTNGKVNKYCLYAGFGPVDNMDTLEPKDDVAFRKWGEGWRMPTEDDFVELWENCKIEFHPELNCFKVISRKNFNFIYMPSSGHKTGSDLRDEYEGEYWTSTVYYESDCANYFILNAFDNSSNGFGTYNRPMGRVVRPVHE